MKTTTKLGSIAAMLVISASASAWEAGDWIVHGGAVRVDPNDDSSSLVAGGTALPGTGVSVDEDTQLWLGLTWMATDHIGVDVLAASPFTHTVYTEGLSGYALPDVELADVTHLPPTVTLNWFPAAASSKFQPYIGLGLNYTLIFDEDLSNQAKTRLGASNLKLDDSWGLAAHAGFDYRINDCWSIGVGLWYIDIDTEAKLNTAVGAVQTDVDIDPWVYSIGVGYKF